MSQTDVLGKSSRLLVIFLCSLHSHDHRPKHEGGGDKYPLALKFDPLVNGVLTSEIISFYEKLYIRTEEIAFGKYGIWRYLQSHRK